MKYPQNISGTCIVSLTFPNDEKLRSRKVVTRSRARATGKYPSWKMGRMIQWESINELNAYRLLDTDPSVIEFYEQPLKISYVIDGTLRTHYPDTLVKWVNHQELWEIKSPKYAEKPDYLKRTQILEAALIEFGYNYRMINAEGFLKQPRLNVSVNSSHLDARPHLL